MTGLLAQLERLDGDQVAAIACFVIVALFTLPQLFARNTSGPTSNHTAPANSNRKAGRISTGGTR